MNCPICHKTNLSPVHDNLMQCNACDHVFEWPCRRTATYNAEYIKRYKEYDNGMSFLRIGFVKALVRSGKMLDVGYGSGSFVKTAVAAGFDAYGNDIHGEDLGIKEKSLLSEDMWDVVTFFDSLEHFEDFDEVRGLAKRANWIVISLPHRPDAFPLNLTWKHYKPGEHLHYFSIESLKRLFENKTLIKTSDLEDSIRGRSTEQNILTAVFTS